MTLNEYIENEVISLDQQNTIKSMVQYGFAHYPELSKPQMWTRMLEHINAKYAESGYLKRWIKESNNAQELEKLRAILADKKEIRKYFDKYYSEEKFLPKVCDRFLNDEHYREGHIHILACRPGTEVIGLHKPEMQEFAMEIVRRDDWHEIIKDWEEFCPISHEERSIWGLCIDYAKCSLKERLEMMDKFVEVIDNWAICDTFCCNSDWVRKNKKEVWEHIEKYLCSEAEFTRRVGIIMMLRHYLSEDYIDATFKRLTQMHLHEGEPYYIRMGVAWLLATALAKSEEKTRAFVSSPSSRIPDDIKKLYIRKARESLITKNVKAV